MQYFKKTWVFKIARYLGQHFFSDRLLLRGNILKCLKEMLKEQRNHNRKLILWPPQK